MKGYTPRKYWLGTILVLTGCGADSVPSTPQDDSRFAAIGALGEPLAGRLAEATCVQDSLTGLMWERKSDAAGLHDWQNTYTWFAPEEAHNELDYRGTENGGECAKSKCDTWHFVAAVNELGYCGHHDWRVPGKNELASISDPTRSKTPPTLNVDAFPLTHAAEYWTANDYSFQWDAAWAWNFQFGHDRVDWKKQPKPVRLVRGEALELERVKE
jgi:hypothetical protein